MRRSIKTRFPLQNQYGFTISFNKCKIRIDILNAKKGNFFCYYTNKTLIWRILAPAACIPSCATCQKRIVCLSCYTGFYSSNTNCIACNSSCLNCTGPSSDNCISCSSTIPLYLNGGSCVANCPSQTYKNNNTFTCSNCNYHACLNCSFCTSCPSTYILVNNQCVSQCPIYTYYNSNGTCLNCYNFCLTCNGSNINQCTSCNSALGLYLYQGYCLSNCQIGRFANIASSTCDNCYLLCRTCQGPTNTNCLSYDGAIGLYLYQGNCLNFCPSGTYLNIYSSSCEACYNTCLECSSSGSNNCISCDNSLINLFLYQHNCLNNCPVGNFYKFYECFM